MIIPFFQFLTIVLFVYKNSVYFCSASAFYAIAMRIKI